jgi:cation diffusion facilitator family transporter
MKEQVARAKRTAVAAAGITLLLIAAKGIVGAVARSTALLADALHSTTDLLAIATSWFGLRIASREPTERFPYGFYRAETFAALAASGIILYLGGRLLWRGISSLRTVPALFHPDVAIATALASAGAALVLSAWEKRVSRETGSQSLGVTADDTRLDALTSLGVFVALLAARFRVPVFEGAATILISGLVLWVGIKNARLSILCLMDASVSPDLEREIAQILSQLPGVDYVEKVRARRSGPFYFVDGHIHVAGSMHVTRSHALTHEAQEVIRKKRPEVEGVILHVEPRAEKTRRVIVPVAGQEGMSAGVGNDFGQAGWFLIATFEEGRLLDHTVEPNPFQANKLPAGLAAISRFVREKKISAAVVREIGEIAYHALHDNYVEILRVPDGSTAEDALRAYAAGSLDHLAAPTRGSETATAEEESHDGKTGE